MRRGGGTRLWNRNRAPLYMVEMSPPGGQSRISWLNYRRHQVLFLDNSSEQTKTCGGRTERLCLDEDPAVDPRPITARHQHNVDKRSH